MLSTLNYFWKIFPSICCVITNHGTLEFHQPFYFNHDLGGAACWAPMLSPHQDPVGWPLWAALTYPYLHWSNTPPVISHLACVAVLVPGVLSSQQSAAIGWQCEGGPANQCQTDANSTAFFGELLSCSQTQPGRGKLRVCQAEFQAQFQSEKHWLACQVGLACWGPRHLFTGPSADGQQVAGYWPQGGQKWQGHPESDLDWDFTVICTQTSLSDKPSTTRNGTWISRGRGLRPWALAALCSTVPELGWLMLTWMVDVGYRV